MSANYEQHMNSNREYRLERFPSYFNNIVATADVSIINASVNTDTTM